MLKRCARCGAGTVLQVQDHGGGWLALAVALVPDLGLLAGIDRGLQKNRIIGEEILQAEKTRQADQYRAERIAS